MARVLVVVTFVFVVAACGGEQRAISAAAPEQDQAQAVARDCAHAEWPGPWTACAEADWVRRVAEVAGYRVVGETGSALIVAGRGDSFYIWTTRHETERPVAQTIADEGWTKLGRASGAAIYGDADLWRWWSTEDTVFWLKAGPRESSTVPDVAELDELVAASLRLNRRGSSARSASAPPAP